MARNKSEQIRLSLGVGNEHLYRNLKIVLPFPRFACEIQQHLDNARKDEKLKIALNKDKGFSSAVNYRKHEVGTWSSDRGRAKRDAYYEQELSIPSEVENRAVKGGVHENFGVGNRYLGGLASARENHEQELSIARKVEDRAGEGSA